MSDAQHVPNDVDFLNRVRGHDAEVVELAELLSLASRIDRRLLRLTRLEFMPRSRAELEHRFWFGPLIEVRSADAVVLNAGFLPYLRKGLYGKRVSRRAGEDKDLLDATYELTERATKDAQPALRLEQRVTWMALVGASERELQRLLGSVLKALFEHGRTGLIVWAARAIPRLPPRARTLEVSQRILTISQLLLGAPAARKRVPSVNNRWDWRSWVKLLDGDPLRLYLRFERGGLVLSMLPLHGDEISLPRSDPLAVEVSWSEPTGRYVQLVNLRDRGRILIRSAADSFTLRFADGNSIRVDSPDLGVRPVEGRVGLMDARRKLSDDEWTAVFGRLSLAQELVGRVFGHVRGGFAVESWAGDIKFPCFLPGSQVDTKHPESWDQWIGQQIRAEVIELDRASESVVISRRKFLLAERRKNLLSDIQEGQIRVGIVKGLADFGAFVDLGGIIGLLHISEMSWGRIQHPSELLQVGQELEVKVLHVDTERMRTLLSLKQLRPSPWEDIESRYPVNSKHVGEVVSIMSYGAFVKLEDGVEGLVSISEMSWTRRINHASELVKSGDKVEVVVLEYNKEKQKISLGMKQAETNPWDLVEEHYPIGTVIEGTVRNLTTYGVFVEIEEGIDGLLHVSDMSWTKKITHPSEMVRKGDKLRCVVLRVDTQKKRIALGYKQLAADPWVDHIPSTYHVGDLVVGVVTKVVNFGVFAELEDGIEGLLHISELPTEATGSLEDTWPLGLRVRVRVIRVDAQERKIALKFVDANFTANERVRRERPPPVAAPPSRTAPAVPQPPDKAELADSLRAVRARISRDSSLRVTSQVLSTQLRLRKALIVPSIQAALGATPEWSEPLSTEQIWKILDEVERRFAGS